MAGRDKPYPSFSMRCKPLVYGVLALKNVTYSIRLSQPLDFLNDVQYNTFEQCSIGGTVWIIKKQLYRQDVYKRQTLDSYAKEDSSVF